MADPTENAMKDFRDNLAICTQVAACKRQYIRITKWTSWLTSKVVVKIPNYETTQVSRLLEVAYRRLGAFNKPTLPINKDQVCHSQHGCMLIFSILLELGVGSLVDQFFRLDKGDRHLPFNLIELKTLFSQLQVSSSEQKALDFDKLQWKYCPAKLEFKGTRQHLENRIMPFCGRSPINSKGGTAQLWQIAVLEEFVEERLREAVKESKFEADDGLGPRYEFALKAFEDGNKKLFLNEKEAFQALDKQSAMVQFLCEYSHEEAELPFQDSWRNTVGSGIGRIRPTHNIILEYGESDLEEYFADTVPPYLQAEVDAFWGGLFVVADAVKSIHNLTVDSDGRKEDFSGWHADIKPDNILLVHGKFKLADPGFMKMVKKTDKEPAEVLSGGTETYGAPERHPGWTGIPSRVDQTIDTWSLGCVFSIAATWVVLGYQGIRQYNEIRKQAIKKLAIQRVSVPGNQLQKSSATHGDHFHDGKEILPAVLDWHNVLRNALRKTDTITSRVLDLVEKKMLVGDAKSRIKATQTCEVLEKILKEAESEPRIPVPENIKELLREVDDAGTAPSETLRTQGSNSTVTAPLLNIPTIAQARKSKFVDPPLLKTTHRSQVLRPWSAKQQGILGETLEAVPESLASRPHIDVPPLSIETTNCPLNPIAEMTTAQKPGSYLSVADNEVESTQQPLQAYPPRQVRGHESMNAHQRRSRLVTRKSTTRGRQDIFQVRAEVDLQLASSSRWKSTKKDGFLSRFFKNRDIKFLVDNAETMKEHWGLATYVLETLLMKARGQDENGMDLHFTSGEVKVEGREFKGNLLAFPSHSNPFTKAMTNSQARPMESWHTDITKPLKDIFDRYLDDADRSIKASSRKPKQLQCPRNLTLIILTDGIWAGMKDWLDVKTLIVEFVLKVEKLVGQSLVKRQVSIEFVQFGDDADASHRLSILDNDLVYNGIPDIVDTEHWSGDPIKMLLGSFNSQYDEKEDDEETINSERSRYSRHSIDTLKSLSRSDSRLFRPEFSTSQATQRSIHSPATPSPLIRVATGTPERQNGSGPTSPSRHQSSPRVLPHQGDG